MIFTHSVETIRKVVQEAADALPTEVLREKAVSEIAGTAYRMLRKADDSAEYVIAFVGEGDNGRDALYATSILAMDMSGVEAILLTDHPHERALAEARFNGVTITDASNLSAEDVADLAKYGTLWIDGILSTGTRGELREPIRSIIAGLESIRTEPPHPRVSQESASLNDPRGEEHAAVSLVGTKPEGSDEKLTPKRNRWVAEFQVMSAAPIEVSYGAPLYDPRRQFPTEQSVRDYRRRVVAINNHSGEITNDGRINGPALYADTVVTIGAITPALLLPPAAYLHKRIRLVDLTLNFEDEGQTRTLGFDDFFDDYPAPGPLDHKYTRGVVQMIVGSEQYPGATVLGVLGAQNTGVGMVRLETSQTPKMLALQAAPGIVLGTGRSQAIAVGSGMDPEDNQTRERIETALQDARVQSIPVVIDAGALSVAARLLAEGFTFTAPTVWTPHAGEAAAVLTILDAGEWSREKVEAAPLVAARRLAELTGGIIVMKGAITLIVNPAGTVYTQTQAPSWAAVAGSGDVLTGIVAARVAHQQVEVEREAGAPSNGNQQDWSEKFTRAVASAVWLHGAAASKAAGVRSGMNAEIATNSSYPDFSWGWELEGNPIAALDIASNLGRVIWDTSFRNRG
ncbi:MAG: NAD(P)H-hydrate dehydratase [Actinomycetaceae bacterium]|nr:NAD(P)H-hydrate dehydratase [Actinomycetaceae bacterium]